MTRAIDVIGTGWRFPVGVDGRGGLALVDGDEEIAQAMQIILGTPVGQRVMRPEFGCRIHELLFAPINAGTIAAVSHFVEEALGYWEPRAEVLSVDVQRDPDQPTCLLIYISYRIKATYEQRALVFPFYTIPGEE
jgi:uncharacterized protein